jgi:Ca-activated chloride channel family protein
MQPTSQQGRLRAPFAVLAAVLAAAGAAAAPTTRPATRPAVDPAVRLAALQKDVTQGALRVFKDDGAIVECPLKHTDVQAEVSGFLARVRVTQVFENPTDERIEAVYVFPLPHKAAVDEMTLVIGPRRIVGLIKRRAEARRIYQAALARGRTAALLEQERPNIFTQSVGNIPPAGQVRIEIAYVDVLEYDLGEYEFHFPMVVGPRYIPGSPLSSTPPVPAELAGKVGELPQTLPPAPGVPGPKGTGWSPDTARVPDASRITPPVLKPGFRTGHDIALSLSLDAGVPVGALVSTNHQVRIHRRGPTRARVKLSEADAIPNKSFVLRYKVVGRKPQMAVLAHRPKGKAGYFLLMVQPAEDERLKQSPPRELVFLVDVSGSMSGKPIAKVREAMGAMLKLCRKQDTLQVVTFAGYAQKLFARPLAATAQNVAKALGFSRGFRGGGGTRMLEGVRLALAEPPDPKRVRIIVMLTDGYIGNEAEIIAEVGRRAGDRVRFWCIGIGGEPNRFLVDGVARQGGGMSKVLRLEDDLAKLATEVMARIQRAQLGDVRIDWAGAKVYQTYPARIPELWAGRPITLFGRYDSAGPLAVAIHGKVEGEPVRWPLSVDLPAEQAAHAVLAKVWARRRIEDLMHHAYYGDDPQIAEAVTEIALTYRLMSQYTSFVAVDEKEAETPDDPQPRLPRRMLVPVPIPAGTRYEGFFGPYGEQPQILRQLELETWGDDDDDEEDGDAFAPALAPGIGGAPRGPGLRPPALRSGAFSSIPSAPASAPVMLPRGATAPPEPYADKSRAVIGADAVGYDIRDLLVPKRHRTVSRFQDAIPWYQTLTYPQNWAEIAARRAPYSGSEKSEDPANRWLRKRLQQTVPQLSFDKTRFALVIHFFREVIRAPIDVRWQTIKAARVTRDTPVNVKLEQVSLETALRILLDDVSGYATNDDRLSYVLKDGRLILSTYADLKGSQPPSARTTEALKQAMALQEAGRLEKAHTQWLQVLLESSATKTRASEGGPAGEARARLGEVHAKLVEKWTQQIPALGRKLDVVVRGATVSDALKQVGRAAGIQIRLLAGSEADAAAMIGGQECRITYLDLRHATLAAALDWICAPMGIEWWVADGRVTAGTARRREGRRPWVYDLSHLIHPDPTELAGKPPGERHKANLLAALDFHSQMTRARQYEDPSVRSLGTARLLVIADAARHEQVAGLLAALADPEAEVPAALKALQKRTAARAAWHRKQRAKARAAARTRWALATINHYSWRLLAAAMDGKLDLEALTYLKVAARVPGLKDLKHSAGRAILARAAWTLRQSAAALPDEPLLRKHHGWIPTRSDSEQIVHELHSRPDRGTFREALYAALMVREDAKSVEPLKRGLLGEAVRKHVPAAEWTVAASLLRRARYADHAALRKVVEARPRGADLIVLTALACRRAGGEAWRAFRAESGDWLARQPLPAAVVLLISRLDRPDPPLSTVN